MKISLGSNPQVEMDFMPGRTQLVVYNKTLNLVGLLTSNHYVNSPFVLINHSVEKYGRDGFSDAIVLGVENMFDWEFISSF
jgi:hypothetical protein